MSDSVTYDWSVLDLEGVERITEQATRRVHRRYRDTSDYDDLLQEARVLVVGDNLRAREYVEDDNLGGLQHRLEQYLVKKAQPEVTRRAQTISLGFMQAAEDGEEGSFIRPYVATATASSQYNRESVETLMPAIWDDTYAYGLPRRETAPDPDMPKGSGGNKAHGNNLAAYIADVKVGWEKAKLTFKERRALLMAYGLGWPPKDIAAHEGVSRQTIEERVINGVGKIMDQMNGGLWYDLTGVEA